MANTKPTPKIKPKTAPQPVVSEFDARRKRPEERVVRRQISLTPADVAIIDELGKRWHTTKLMNILRQAIRVAQERG